MRPFAYGYIISEHNWLREKTLLEDSIRWRLSEPSEYAVPVGNFPLIAALIAIEFSTMAAFFAERKGVFPIFQISIL